MAKGDIGSVVDINQLITDGSGYVYHGNILLLSTGLVAIAMAGKDGDGYLQTFSVNASGVISDAIDSLEFETTVLASRPWLIHISGEVYAIAYEGTGNSGIVVTVTIDSGGNIGAAIIASYTFTAANCANPMIEHVSGTTYVIAYEENDVWPENATMDTLTINDDGTIPGAILDSWDFYAASYGYAPIVRHIANDVFAVAWKGGDSTGFVALWTFTISAVGAITKAPIGGVSHASMSSTIGFDRIKGTVYGYTCGASNPSPWEPTLYTINITDAGVVTDLSSLVLDTTSMIYSSFTVSTDASFIICAFTAGSYALSLYSVLVSDLGVLTLQDSLIATAGRIPAIVLVLSGFVVETGNATSATGYIQSISIDEGALTVYPSSIDSVELFGSDLVGLSVVPAGITTVEAFGSATIFPSISIIDSSVVNDYSAVGRCIVVSTSAPSGKRIFVFYRDPLNGGKYSYTDNDGVSWTTASFLTGSVVSEINSVRADMGPVVGMGPEIIHILYDDAVGDGACYNLCYRTLNPVTLVLGTEEVIDSGDISEGDTLTVGDLFVDSSDIPHVVYHFTEWTSGLSAIIYMDRSAPGGTWIGGVDLEIVSGYVDSRLGSYGWAGTDVVVGMISNSGANTFLKAKEYVGGVWGSTVTVDSIAPPDGFTGLHVSNVVRTISYTSLTTIRLATESGGSWSHVTLDSAGTSYSGVSTSYFIDGGGDRRVHYWYDYDAGLLYEYRTNKETISTHYDSCGVCDCINVTPPEAFFAYCDESGGTYTLKFGINQWVSEQTVYSSSITSAETFGMGRMDQQLLSTGIASEEVFGSGRVDQQLLAVSIASAESVSNPAVGLGLWPPSITTEELFGTSRIDQQLMASGIPSGEVFGSEIVHRQITSIDVPTDGGTDSPVNWDTPTPTPGLPPTGWNDGGTTRSQSSTHRYSPTHKYKAHFLLEVVLGKAGGNMSSMDMETAITIGGEEYKAPTFRMEVYTE